MEFLWTPKVRDNPYNFVRYAFKWGEPGPLERFKGPREWQKEELLKIAEHIDQNHEKIRKGDPPTTYKSATVSGRGPGKSALVSWLALWMMSCIRGSTTIITANTDAQISDKTFGEIGNWHTLMINRFFFERTQKAITPAKWYKELLEQKLDIGCDYHYANGVLWNEESPGDFVGAHSQKGMLVLFDEASSIPENIWVAARGFFTDLTPYRFWLSFSNPRSNTGAFYECFHTDRDQWHTRKIDSRSVEGLDKAEYEEIIKKYGADSDEARIEVYGEFPHQGDNQFISRGLVTDAVCRELERIDDYAPLLMGVDIARYGDDSTVVWIRKGRDARSFPPVILKKRDNMFVANKIAELIENFDPEGVFIDAGGGSGVIDRLREMGYTVFEVNFGSSAEDSQYFDRRTELWGKMREWLGGAMLPNDKELIDDLCSPEYLYMGKEQKLKLESKESMKKRGIHSPDRADALAVTFDRPIASHMSKAAKKGVHRSNRKAKGVGCDVEFD